MCGEGVFYVVCSMWCVLCGVFYVVCSMSVFVHVCVHLQVL